MKTIRTSGRISGALAVAGVVALVATGCTRGGGDSSASPGITDTTLSLGISTPLSGTTAGPGSCTVAGLDSFLEAQNAKGGFEFGDGKTRKVELTYLDDAYDPAKAVSNFRQLVNKGIFAYVGALGTPTNAAVQPLANKQKVPQVLIMAGANQFSDDKAANPWTSAFVPTYTTEGEAFGQLLASAGKRITVATLAQNDDYGTGYLDGFEAGIEGSQVEVVGSATYEPTDTSVDAQVTKLASSKADVLLSAVSVTPLQVGVLTKAQALGWKPRIFLPSNTSTPAAILVPGGAEAYPAVYTSSFAKTPASPAFANDADVKAYNAAFAKYGAKIAKTYTPHCAWSYSEGAVLGQAFEKMKAPTRAAFMTALKSVKGFQAPLLLDGITVDMSSSTDAAVSKVTLVKYTGQGYGPVSGY
jgi:ABC-type branched-subunit amino acid transport system substrate-binding protein